MRITTVQATIGHENIDAFLHASVANGSASVATEDGCLRFDVIQDSEDPGRIGFYEAYTDDAAVEAHSETPHFFAWLEATDGMGDMTWGTCRNVFPSDEAGWAAGPGPEGAVAGGLYVVQPELTVEGEHLAPLIEALTAVAMEAVEIEPGCLRFDVAQSLDDPTAIWLYAAFADAGAYGEHRNSIHRQAFDELTGDWYTTKAVIKGTNVFPPDSWHWTPEVP